MKKYITALLFVLIFLNSCMKDRGNYSYVELGDIRVEGIPAVVEVLSKIERIVVTPKITSSKEGEIKANNPNYSFRYRLGYKGHGNLGGVVNGRGEEWIDLTPTNGFNLDIPANFEATTYICWFTITDKRNNIVHSHVFDIKVTSSTYEGWLVLSNMGPEERVRLDMVSHISATRIDVLHNIATGLPPIHHGTQIAVHPDQNPVNDIIAIFSKEGSYYLNPNTLESSPELEFNRNSFFVPPAETITSMASFAPAGNTPSLINFSFAFSEAGNVYRRPHVELNGSVYGFPINITEVGAAPQFKVAPFIGISQVRPANGRSVLFYDQDNKRFMGLSNIVFNRLFTIPDPSPKLFSFQTGRDMVYMEGTRRSNGLVYAILQDAQGKRSIYGINMAGNGFVQESYYENVSASGFMQATLFAFHSQFPIMFYAVGNKVYLYNLATKTATEMTNITGGEITTLKFNLYKNPRPDTHLNNQSAEFMNKQYQLIVGTYDNSVSNGNGGKVAFYEVNGTSFTVNKLLEYGGFGKVKDVVYRERYK